MLSLLEQSAINRDKDPFYDEIIDAFMRLNSRRNAYVHGLWHTHESGRIFLSEESIDDFYFLEAREVKQKELGRMIFDMEGLVERVLHRHRGRILAEPSKRTV